MTSEFGRRRGRVWVEWINCVCAAVCINRLRRYESVHHSRFAWVTKRRLQPQLCGGNVRRVNLAFLHKLDSECTVLVLIT
ncbi:hypothetical protein V5799_003253 [Amblyomma americanum]|uniref:Uncharacterized protein n=1 Tax=Amblyomma americanum TaxID=6943 RepID=A0AAQ4D9H5_AMBAM